jgi:hypothetical protein
MPWSTVILRCKLKKKRNPMKKLTLLLLPLALMACGDKDKRTPAQFAEDAVKKYETMIEHGRWGSMDLCGQAMYVSKSYLIAEDYANFSIWEEKKVHPCNAAGMSKVMMNFK